MDDTDAMRCGYGPHQMMEDVGYCVSIDDIELLHYLSQVTAMNEFLNEIEAPFLIFKVV